MADELYGMLSTVTDVSKSSLGLKVPYSTPPLKLYRVLERFSEGVFYPQTVAAKEAGVSMSVLSKITSSCQVWRARVLSRRSLLLSAHTSLSPTGKLKIGHQLPL